MDTLDIRTAAAGLRQLVITPAMSDEEAATSMQFLAPFNQCMLGVVCFSGQTPWERHPEGDELLQVQAARRQSLGGQRHSPSASPPR